MSISLDQLSNVLYSLFLLYAKNEDYQNILKLSCGPLFFTSYNAFLKKLRCLELASLPHFLMIFEKKIFLILYSITRPNFIVWWSLLREILSNMCIAIVFFTRLWHHEFWNQPCLSDQAVFLLDQKVKTKT